MSARDLIKEDEFFTSGQLVKILNFTVTTHTGKDHLLAINIQKIKEIVDDVELQTLPEDYFPFLGLYNLRGIPVPVILLSSFFDDQDTQKNTSIENSRIVICEFQKMLIGLLVTKTGKIETLANKDVKPVPQALDLTSKRLYNGHIVKESGEFVHLLDVELILDSLQVDLGFSKEIQGGPQFDGMKVLIVEDSRLFQKKLQMFFTEKLGMEVLMAEDGEEGLELIEKNQDQLDLIFTDIEMPHLNGIGMIRKMKKKGLALEVPVIFNTSISNPALVEDITAEALGEYIVKFDEGTISQVVENILKSKA